MKDFIHRLTRTHISITRPGVCQIIGCVPLWGTPRYRAKHTKTFIIAEGVIHKIPGEDQLEDLHLVETMGELNAWLRNHDHTCSGCVQSTLVRP